ncbi:MAG TPA: hypothetical protein DHD79_12215 [Firmicutes bacterium]|jgi:ribosomal protein S18 acetylase RimI-like enzyme|nr:hypothetical protein [Bacillota bacterium]HAW71045.1 hypothetical protein [Bacillota bacterium]HAZ21632.1 hypothetical protein [Bacillota bacterium]HBE05113.1 hypothetical protein [Bacillota bacterium]HBG44794.1 hypothetical protein [Bacillota bacterium]
MQYDKMLKEEINDCALLAARAFETYEYFSNYIPDDSTRSRFLKQMLQTEMSVKYPSADILVAKENGKIIAVAMLCPPNYKKPSDLKYILAGFLKLYRIVDKKTVSEWLEMEKKSGEPCHSIGGNYTWYLNSLTVDPNGQGTGIGSKMLQECVIPHVKANGGDLLTLFTNNKRNCAFYEKNGFTEFHQTSFQYRDTILGSWSFKMEV